ncbi:MAG TPA: ATPase, T2SS/T4P/T4SS family [Vicinamibacterales bacterium]|nr:ATPase, T2SS/T4P/T4SS family [Vicinamibacterales bacterium]
MSIVPSLLQAVIHVDGEALVMHAGEKPYVVAAHGQTDLASRGLALDAVNGIVNQLLPSDFQNALDEFGAVQYELPAMPQFPGEHFTVVAARGGDDVWVEIRRRRARASDLVPEQVFEEPPPASHDDIAEEAPVPPPPAPIAAVVEDDDVIPLEMIGEHTPEPQPGDAIASMEMVEAVEADRPEDLLLPDASQLWPDETAEPVAVESEEISIDLDASETYETAEPEYEPPPSEAAPPPAMEIVPPPPIEAAPPAAMEIAAPSAIETATPLIETAPPPVMETAPPPVMETAPPPVMEIAPPPLIEPAPPPVAEQRPAPPPPAPPRQATRSVQPASPPRRAAEPPPPAPRAVEPPPPARAERPPSTPSPVSVTPPRRPAPPQPAVVLPISRSPIRIEPPPPPAAEAAIDGLDRLLRVSAARGASALYLSSDAHPSVRVDGELQMLDGEPELTARDVESLLLTLMPERSHEALRTGATTEWIVDIEDVGRVRCMSFRDHHGPGGIFRLMPMRSVSVDQLGLPREIQALAIEPEGLVLVAGPRSSGKRTLMAAYVDLINRSRRDHVITIEREINIVHERGHSFVSQREVRGNDDDLLAAARAALREDPDVLVIEDLRTGALMNVALEASASGRLVIGGFSAHTAAAAIDRIIDLYAPEDRRQVQLALADNLRGVIVQVLLHKTGGGRVAAREVLLNTPAVASALAEGKTSQLAMAIEGGRRLGMMPLNDALVGFVQSGTVDSREAYRYASDRAGFLAQLKRQGLDTSFVERLA